MYAASCRQSVLFCSLPVPAGETNLSVFSWWHCCCCCLLTITTSGITTTTSVSLINAIAECLFLREQTSLSNCLWWWWWWRCAVECVMWNRNTALLQSVGRQTNGDRQTDGHHWLESGAITVAGADAFDKFDFEFLTGESVCTLVLRFLYSCTFHCLA